MNILREAEDYFHCSVSVDTETGKFNVKEEVFDHREEQGYQYSFPLIATGFNTIDEAQRWIDDKRKEQEIDEMIECSKG